MLEERQLIVSESTISECVRGMHYSFKRVTKGVENAFHAEHEQARHEYATWMLYDALPQQKSLIFYDECPFNVSTRRHYGRAPKGEKAIGRVPRQTQNRTLMAALAKGRLLFFKILNKKQNGNTENMT